MLRTTDINFKVVLAEKSLEIFQIISEKSDVVIHGMAGKKT